VPPFVLLETTASVPSNSPIVAVVDILFPVGLALLHVFIGRLNAIEKILPRYRWLSLGAGVSIAYVFLDILPELSHAQTEVDRSGIFLVEYLEKHVYVLALVGLALFYGLEVLAVKSRRENISEGQGDDTDPGVFWVHIGAFAMYNGLIGELLSNTETRGIVETIILCVALALHFLANDASLRNHHKKTYDRLGRWILAAALMLGWVLGRAFDLNEAIVAAIWAFVAGGILLNTLKEELPSDRQTCFRAFAIGMAAYGAILLLV